LVRRLSGAEGDTIGGGRAATLSGLTAPLSAFHRAIVGKSANSVSLDDDCPNQGILVRSPDRREPARATCHNAPELAERHDRI